MQSNSPISVSITTDQIDLLIHEYNNSATEYLEILGEYRKQINLLHYYITIFTGVMIILLSPMKDIEPIASVKLQSEYVFALALVFSLSLLYYIYSNAIDIVYNLYLVEAKRGGLELRLNKLVGVDSLLSWDSKVVLHFNEDIVFRKGWLNPSVLTATASGMIVIVITTIHCVLAYLLMPTLEFKYYFVIVAWIISSFLLHQFAVLHTSGKKYIFDYVYAQGALILGRGKVRTTVSFVPILTFLIGSFAFAVFSLKEDAFWPTSRVSFPYLYIWSMSLGDTFLLPIINYKIADLFFNILPRGYVLRGRRLLFRWGVALAIIAIGLSTLTHYSWVTDEYTDFIAINPGVITVGGLWHAVFSVFQTFLFGIYYVLWWIAIRGKSGRAVEAATRLWWWVLAFSALMIANFVQQYLTVYDGTLLDSLVDAKFTLLPLGINIVLGLILKNSMRRKPSP